MPLGHSGRADRIGGRTPRGSQGRGVSRWGWPGGGRGWGCLQGHSPQGAQPRLEVQAGQVRRRGDKTTASDPPRRCRPRTLSVTPPPTSSGAPTAPDQGPGSAVWTLGPWEEGPPRSGMMTTQCPPSASACRTAWRVRHPGPGLRGSGGWTSPSPPLGGCAPGRGLFRSHPGVPGPAPTAPSAQTPLTAQVVGRGPLWPPRGAVRRWRDCSDVSDSPTGTPERPAERYSRRTRSRGETDVLGCKQSDFSM